MTNDFSFSSLPLDAALLQNLNDLGYQKMTPIQAKSLPLILQNKDVIGQGETGTGKTAAFGLGVLHKIKPKQFQVQSLILCPTRELAEQVGKELRRLARAIPNIKILTVYGGTPFKPQADSLSHGAHIVIGTPGRIEDHLNRQTLSLDTVETLVLDEADKMLEMGFQEVLETIIAQTPNKRQTLLFSATFPKQTQTIAKKIMRAPEKVSVESTQTKANIQQYFYPASENRLDALQRLLHHHQPDACLIFCNTKLEVKKILSTLSWFGAVALHGDLEQRERDQALAQFANGSARIMIATDVAARGLDIDNLPMVINYQLPRDAETYTHRIGRTGRAGNTGVACALHDDSEHFQLMLLQDILGEITDQPLPDASVLERSLNQPAMQTLYIASGKKQKLRPGDILGTLTKESIAGKQIGKIYIFDTWTLVAVEKDITQLAIQTLNQNRVKGKRVRVSLLK